jgi:hypothetical protein
VQVKQAKADPELASRIRHGKSAIPSKIPDGGIDFDGSANKLGSLTSRSSKVDFSQWPELREQRKQLQKKGYNDPEALAHMMDTLSQMDKTNQDRVMKIWLSRSADERKAKMAEYKKAWPEKQAAKASSGASGSGSKKGVNEADAKAQLQQKGYTDPNALLYMLKRLADDPGKAAAQTKKWLGGRDDETRGFAKEYAKRWRDEHPDQVVSATAPRAEADANADTSGGTQMPWRGASGGSSLASLINLGQLKQDLAPMFPDPVVRDGMIEVYRSYGDVASANAMVQQWKTNTAKRQEWNESFRIVGKRAQAWRRELADRTSQLLPMPMDETMDALNQRLIKSGLWTGAPQRYGMLWCIWRLPPAQQETKMKQWLEGEDLQKQEGNFEQSGQQYYNKYNWYRQKVDGRAEVYQGIFYEVKTIYDAEGLLVSHEDRADERHGAALSAAQLGALQRQAKWSYLTISDQSVILDILSRPRSEQQEAAVLSLLKSKGVSVDMTGASRAVAKMYPLRIDPNIIHLARAKLQELGNVQGRETLLNILSRVEHSEGEMKKIGQVLRALGMRPFLKMPLADGRGRHDAADFGDVRSAEFVARVTSFLRIYLPHEGEYDSLMDGMLKQDGPGKEAYSVKAGWEDMVKLFHTHGPEAGLRALCDKYGDPMAIKGGKTDRLKAAEWIEQMKIQLRPHYAEHIVDAMVTDQIDSHRDSRNLAMPYKPYVKLAENAKKAGASAEAKAKYRELIATYTKQASHEGYNQGREQDMEEGNLYRIIRGEVTGTTRWNWK